LAAREPHFSATDPADIWTRSWLSLTFDTGGEVFERVAVATAKPLGRPQGRGMSDLEPTSAIVVRLAGS